MFLSPWFPPFSFPYTVLPPILWLYSVPLLSSLSPRVPRRRIAWVTTGIARASTVVHWVLLRLARYQGTATPELGRWYVARPLDFPPTPGGIARFSTKPEPKTTFRIKPKTNFSPWLLFPVDKNVRKHHGRREKTIKQEQALGPGTPSTGQGHEVFRLLEASSFLIQVRPPTGCFEYNDTITHCYVLAPHAVYPGLVDRSGSLPLCLAPVDHRSCSPRLEFSLTEKSRPPALVFSAKSPAAGHRRLQMHKFKIKSPRQRPGATPTFSRRSSPVILHFFSVLLQHVDRSGQRSSPPQRPPLLHGASPLRP